MRREYLGENLRPKDPVHYYDEHALKVHLVFFRDGLILDHSGMPITSYLNQSSIYVITSDHRFLISRYSKHNLIHHSSLSAGAPLLASGELVIQDGVLLRINLESGHYRFPERYLEFVKSYLAERGVRLDVVVFESCVGSLKVASQSSKGT